MLYLRCPTCKTILANKQIPFEEGINSICKKNNLSDKEKDKQKMELLDNLQLKRYCCRTRIMTFTKLIEIIK